MLKDREMSRRAPRNRRLRVATIVAFASACAVGCDLGLTPFQEDAGVAPTPTTPTDSGGTPDTSRPPEDAGGDTSTTDAMVDAPLDGEAGLAKRVFVTSSVFQGSFNGIQGADAICAQHAVIGMLGGTWKAWISVNNTNAIQRVTEVGPWYLPDRKTLVFPNLAAIAANGNPAVAIDRDEKNAVVQQGAGVWTGTNRNGTANGNNCQNFTTNGVVGGLTGRVTNNANWSEADNQVCQAQHRIYCFEQ